MANIKIPFTGDLSIDEDNTNESMSYFHFLAQQPGSQIFYILCKNTNSQRIIFSRLSNI